MSPRSDNSIPAVVYAAKSTSDPNGSIDTQIEDCRKAAEAEGQTVVGEYSDENASAFKGNRGGDLAKAKEHAIRVGAQIWVQHSDRVARGDGITADHLAEVWFALRRTGVRMRSVQDDHNLEDAIRVVLIGERNHEDSKRKAMAVASGMGRSRERGDAGWLFRGIKPDGYVCLYDTDAKGKVTREAIKDPDRKDIWECFWEMAAAGASAPAIQLEFAKRGYRTAPVKSTERSRGFDVHRIDHAMRNPIYAGYVHHKGKITGEGNWPRYVEPEVFHRIQDERKDRKLGAATRRPPGRPAKVHLLVGTATCGECGRKLHATSYGKRRKDGSVCRRYFCPGHHEYVPGTPDYCAALPYDAAVVDRLVLDGIDRLLSDADTLRDQLGGAMRIDQQRLEHEVEKARAAHKKAIRVTELAQADYESALEEGDSDRAKAALTTVVRKTKEATAAEALMNSALVALETPVDMDEGDYRARIYEVLAGRVADADNDVAQLRTVCAETFEEFKVIRTERGIRVVPVISAAVLARTMRTPDAFMPGAVSAVVLGEDGCVDSYYGAHLRDTVTATTSRRTATGGPAPARSDPRADTACPRRSRT
jgi:DNA invertase Pin-like site-specific DNA recombinase